MEEREQGRGREEPDGNAAEGRRPGPRQRGRGGRHRRARELEECEEACLLLLTDGCYSCPVFLFNVEAKRR